MLLILDTVVRVEELGRVVQFSNGVVTHFSRVSCHLLAQCWLSLFHRFFWGMCGCFVIPSRRDRAIKPLV